MKKLILLSIISFFVIFHNQADACTSFIISGKYTVDGKPLLLKNRDTGEMRNSLVIYNDGKYKYMAVTNSTERGMKSSVWGGYNEKGFAIMNTAAYNNNVGDSTSPGDQDGVVTKLALMVCCSLEDFEHFLDTLTKPMGVNSNYGVIDANGGAAYYETGNYKYVKVDANDPKQAPYGIVVRTNHSMSGDKELGSGFNRFNNASIILNQAALEKKLAPEYLINAISRSLYHPRIQADLADEMPAQRDVSEFRFFMDYIPRVSTSSSYIFVGARDSKHVDEMMMWTIIGFPLTTVAVPTWLSAGELPKVVAMGKDLQSPLNTAGLKFKEECFPLKSDNGQNYINLSAVINSEGTGYTQIIRHMEKTIAVKANELIGELDAGTKKPKDIQEFYQWLDKYLLEQYQRRLNYKLF
ncbi:MAG: C45 family peptidase [Bacteroidetes bacterium]|nr:C45 family peptidase [Bacteroidota bacterium]